MHFKNQKDRKTYKINCKIKSCPVIVLFHKEEKLVNNTAIDM